MITKLMGRGQNQPKTPFGVMPRTLNQVSPAMIIRSQAMTIMVIPNLNVSEILY